MSTTRKVLLVLGGYLAALGVAWLTLTVYVATTNTPDRQASAGMYAFGDLVLFLGTFGVASLPATGAVFYFLRPNPTFWHFLSRLAIVLAASAVVAGAAYFAAGTTQTGWLYTLGMLSPLRILAAPVLALFCLLAALFAPARRTRVCLLVAVGAEVLLFATFLLRVVWSTR